MSVEFANTGLRIGADSVEIDDVGSVLSALTQGGIRKIVAEEWQLWRLRITLERDFMGRRLAAAKINGHRFATGWNPFTTEMPQTLGVTVPSRTVRLAAAASARDPQIAIDATGSFDVQMGTFFTIANDPKVYLAAQDYRGSSSAGTMSVYPALRKNSVNNAVLDFTPVITVRYLPQAVRTIRYRNNFYAATLELEEVLQ